MKKTILDQIEVTKDGHIQIRMRKQVIDGDSVFDFGFHRTFVECGGDVDKQMALVNAHLAQMGFGVISAKEIAEIKQHAQIAFTPDRIQAFKLLKEEQPKK